MSKDSLNSGDSFIMDKGLELFILQGKQSSHIEIWDANKECNMIKEARKGLPKVTIYTEDDKDDSPFWELLGGKGPIREKG
jgi:hypothetical protein